MMPEIFIAVLAVLIILYLLHQSYTKMENRKNRTEEGYAGGGYRDGDRDRDTVYPHNRETIFQKDHDTVYITEDDDVVLKIKVPVELNRGLDEDIYINVPVRGRTVLGRDSSCFSGSFLRNATTVSREHMAVYREGNELVFEALKGQRNPVVIYDDRGRLVEKQRAEGRFTLPADKQNIIRMGSVYFCVRYSRPHVQVKTPEDPDRTRFFRR